MSTNKIQCPNCGCIISEYIQERCTPPKRAALYNVRNQAGSWWCDVGGGLTNVKDYAHAYTIREIRKHPYILWVDGKPVSHSGAYLSIVPVRSRRQNKKGTK